MQFVERSPAVTYAQFFCQRKNLVMSYAVLHCRRFREPVVHETRRHHRSLHKSWMRKWFSLLFVVLKNWKRLNLFNFNIPEDPNQISYCFSALTPCGSDKLRFLYVLRSEHNFYKPSPLINNFCRRWALSLPLTLCFLLNLKPLH